MIGEFLGVGLLFSVGDEHKRLRRIVAGPLSRPSVRRLSPVFLTQATKLCSDIEHALEKDGTNTVEIEPLITKAALDVIGVSLLGQEMHRVRSPTSPWTYEECYQKILSPPKLGQFIMFINPFIPLRWIPVKANRDYLSAKAWLEQMMIELIESRTAQIMESKKPDEESLEPRDFLSRMIEASMAADQKLTKRQLIDITLQSIAAGHDTTASGLTWAMYSLAVHTDVQDRLRKEILEARLTEANFSLVDDLPYLNNVVRESLRLYSPALMSPWQAAKDLVIVGVHVPKGTIVQTVPATIQRNPQIWGEDADSFKPDRWDNLKEGALSPFAFEPFINGPRMCPGKALALLEMKVLLVEVIRKFAVEATVKDLGFLNPSLTLKPKESLRLKMRRLN
ncbi:Cytochrome P450 709B2 [Colletotrichum truncatum]|uniref:Cytochrome P450 709B2 n=1 Tax=Colletotrichum truncatum TaxID=5467 RepID=A0ACC3YKA2_COLTU